MDIETYLKRKSQLLEPPGREMCLTCRQPRPNCYCSAVQKFDPGLKFCILIHPLEARRRIATGRMSHLCLQRSELISGHSFSDNPRVNAILQDKVYHSVILYPGIKSTNLSQLELTERRRILPSSKKLCVFVVDGTWSTAKKMVRLSDNLRDLPQISFSPPAPSQFRVRQQPKAECYSTLEAIHHTIELLGETVGFNVETREHDKLLRVFEKLVEQQLVYVQKNVPRHRRYRVPFFLNSATKKEADTFCA